MPRPLDFNQDIANEICELIVDNPMSLKRLVKDERFPSVVTIFRWIENNEAFRNQYTRAKEAQADALFDETLDIADESKEDYIKRKHFEGADEGWEVNGEAIQRAKLRIDTRKWIAGKLRPKKYGDQLQLDQTISAGEGLQELLEAVNGKTRTK